jgi:hypothetical protein
MNNKTHLFCRWSKKENDLLFSYPRRCDGHLLYGALSCKRHNSITNEWDNSIIEELEARGYDIKTLKFSIALKATPAPPVTGNTTT